jgi:hypothetical protein
MFLTKRDRFIKKFQEQLQFIQRSCIAYDEGLEDESIRIAQALRVIFYDSPKSLITHLKFDQKKMLSSAKGYGDTRDYLSWVIDINSSQPVTTRPTLDTQFREISIKEWLEGESVFVYKTKIFSRRKVISNASNKDGGAHVDEKLDKFYEALSAGVEGFSITGNLQYNGESPFQQGVNQSAKNAHLALIRQFAHEFIASVNHFTWLNK